MAFEQLEVKFVKSVDRSPAAVTLYRHSNSTKPAGTAISLRSDIVAAAGFKPESRFKVFIGTGDDAGALRLVEAADGRVRAVFMKRTNAFFVRLGVVEAIGIAPCPRTATEARVIVKGTVEVDIPVLSPGDADEAAADQPAELDAASGASTAETQASSEIFYNGISIDFTDGEESITFDGEGIAVSAMEANLVKLLARTRPAPVGETFLVKTLWNGSAPRNASEQLRHLCTGDLKKGLAKIGLDLREIKGAGYQLKDI